MKIFVTLRVEKIPADSRRSKPQIFAEKTQKSICENL